ncbi:MAG: biotin/lipoyl-containing protein [Anaerolineae bacterium]
MARTYVLKVDGRSYEVEVGDLTASPVVVRVNGREFAVSWQKEAADEVSVVRQVVETKGGLAGDVSLRKVMAPMPGTVLDIRVRPGDEVAFQQELCSLEAMKMKNSIRSPRAGRIATVEVAEGQSVAYGETLFTFA